MPIKLCIMFMKQNYSKRIFPFKLLEIINQKNRNCMHKSMASGKN